jgi:uncharacterized BrkB/YihY/UPF0761 family membrane protein
MAAARALPFTLLALLPLLLSSENVTSRVPATWQQQQQQADYEQAADEAPSTPADSCSGIASDTVSCRCWDSAHTPWRS